MNIEDSIRAFDHPDRYLSEIDPLMISRLLVAATDVGLIIENGVIQDVAMGNAELSKENFHHSWQGKQWIDTVTVESRPKIEQLLARDESVSKRAKSKAPAKARWRQVNHPSGSGLDLPISYTTLKLGDSDRIIALGRDLRSISTLQQRLVEAHQNLERDYSRLRSTEARYEVLFMAIAQPVVIVDAETLVVAESNPAAAMVLGQTTDEILDSPIQDFFQGAASMRTWKQLRSDVQATGEAAASDLRLKSGRRCDVSVTAFRDDESTKLILQIHTEARRAASGSESSSSGLGVQRDRVMGLLEDIPDGLVVVGTDLRILAANKAFASLTNTPHESQLARLRISDYLGRSPTELNVLISNLKSHGVVRNFTTVLRDRFGHEEEVEVSAVATPPSESSSPEKSAAYGFSVRNVARRLRTNPRVSEALPSSVDQLTGLVGRVPMKEIVQESTEFIERLCIEAALEMTSDNRASAAEMLGLSRQGLYSKLKRFGFES